MFKRLIDKFRQLVSHPDSPERPLPSPGPSSAPPPREAAPGAPPLPRAAPGADPKPSTLDQYSPPDILGLSKEELRKRALIVNPYRTAWIGRVDTIPPQSDERTALIDRGLVLRGLLNEAQLAEIHRVGDLWLTFHDSERLASAAAGKTADEAIEEARKARQAAREEKRRQAAERRARRAEEIALFRKTQIAFLGEGVSAGLSDSRSEIEKLEAAGLPVLASPPDLARVLDVSVSRLRWLAFHSEAVTRPHYTYFRIAKKSGGTRLLAAPHKDLEKAQRWIFENILAKIAAEKGAHGFVKGRSTVTNAVPHKGRAIVVNIDLRDFFPSITFPRVRGLFQSLGYSPAVATVLALLCTECPRVEAVLDGKTFYVAAGQRGLPQGAATSPALSNLVARKLDRRLSGLARKRGFIYTRYADDLTFSCGRDKDSELGRFLASVRHILTEEGFTINPKKFRVQRSSARQRVTGIVVNRKLSVPREEVRRIRAILHQAKSAGLAAQNRENLPNFESWLEGKIAYISMVDRARGAVLKAELDRVQRQRPAEDSSSTA